MMEAVEPSSWSRKLAGARSSLQVDTLPLNMIRCHIRSDRFLPRDTPYPSCSNSSSCCFSRERECDEVRRGLNTEHRERRTMPGRDGARSKVRLVFRPDGCDIHHPMLAIALNDPSRHSIRCESILRGVSVESFGIGVLDEVA